MDTKNKIAVITGGSGGLGYATAERLGKLGYIVCILGRSPQKIETKLQELKKSGINVNSYIVDVSSDSDVEEFGRIFQKDFNHCDVLINNAGVFPDPLDWEHPEKSSIFKTTEKLVLDTFNNNTLSVMRVTKALAESLAQSKNGRVVNVSSGMGQLSEMNGLYPAYRLSKTAMNALTRILAEEMAEWGVKVNSICPGWVKTEMGGANAEREINEGIQGIIWAATLPEDGPTGGFFRDGQPLAW